MTGPVAIIGAGIAGLAAAHALTKAGLRVVVYEKSRSIGGRLATRRTRGGLDFDHGAPGVFGEPPAFAALLRAAQDAGDAAPWAGGMIGSPGMSALARSLAAGVEVRFETTVKDVTPTPSGWTVHGEEYPAAICTAPAPQTARICAAIPAIARAAASATMTPCWTLMAAWDGGALTLDAPLPPPLTAAHRVSGKPGRAPTPERWVAHANAAWSADNLEREKEDVAAELLAALAAALGVDPAAASYVAAHRWRFARVAHPVGMACVAVGDIVAAGDWLLGPDAGDAYASGLAAAAAILNR